MIFYSDVAAALDLVRPTAGLRSFEIVYLQLYQNNSCLKLMHASKDTTYWLSAGQRPSLCIEWEKNASLCFKVKRGQRFQASRFLYPEIHHAV